MSETVERLKHSAIELKSRAQQTTEQVDALNDVAWRLRHTEIELVIHLSTEALQLAAQIDYSRGRAFALRGLGWGQLLTDQYAIASQTLIKSRLIFSTLTHIDEAGLASATNILGSAQRYMGDYNNALENHITALDLHKKVSEESQVALVYNNLGGIHCVLGDYALGLDYLYRGLSILSETSAPLFHAWLNCSLGDVLWRVGEANLAVENSQRAVSLFKEHQDYRNEAMTMVNLGAAYHSVQKHQKALHCYQNGLETAIEVNSSESQTEAHIYIGKLYAELGNEQTALVHSFEALRLSKNIGNRYNESQALQQIGSVYQQLGEAKQGIETLELALEVSEQLGFKELCLKTHLALSKAYEKQGKITSALVHYQKFHQYWEDVHGVIASRKIERLFLENKIKQTRREMPAFDRSLIQKQSQQSRSALPPHKLRQVVEFINHHLENDIKVTELSDLASVNYAHFIRSFKQATGKTPHQFVIEQRIERAKTLLRTTQIPLADIALRCGFSSQSHLSTQFRLLTGVSPHQFRCLE